MAEGVEALIQRLLQSADMLSEQQAARLVDEVRQQVESEVRELLHAACKASLLRQVVHELAQQQPADPQPADPQPADPRPADPQPAVAPQPVAEFCSAQGPVRSTDDPAAAEGSTVWPDEEALGLYAYGIVSSDYPLLPRDIVAVDPGSPVQLLRQDDLQIVCSRVNLREFSPRGWAEHVADLDWVEAKLRAHDQALKRAMEQGPLIPLRFGTIFYSHEVVAQLLSANRDRLHEALRRLAGKREWGVKIMRRVGADFVPTRSAENAVEACLNGDDSGRAYLLEKQRHRRTRSEAKHQISGIARQCFEALSEVACEMVVLPVHPRQSQECDSGILHNGSYLLEDSQVKSFRSLVETLAERHHGLSFETTGPWPPYNFVNFELSLRSDE